MFFMVNTAIDTIQSIKSNLVKTFVKDEEARKPLQAYINAQTQFAKKVAQETNTFFTTIASVATDTNVFKAYTNK